MPTQVLVFGRSGQLAGALAAKSIPQTWRLLSTGRDAFDLARTDEIEDAIAALRPDAIVNAAAYTAVDRAESEPEAAFALNRDAPAAMARACAEWGIPLIHISTDYVFDGAKPAPYVETDPKAPLNIYGRSKSEGEDRVLESEARASVIRTSWVYDSSRANFVTTMIRLAREQEEVRVVADQIGRPTWAADLADACVAMLARLLDRDETARGVFHYSGAGDASWADFAETIFAEIEARGARVPRLTRIATAERPSPARRPLNSRLDATKIEALGVTPRAWQEALGMCLSDATLL